MASKPRRNPSGTWSMIVDLPNDPATGKRRQKRITAETRKELESKAAAIIHTAETGFVEPRGVTLAAFWERWCEAKAPTLSRPPRALRDLVEFTWRALRNELARLTRAMCSVVCKRLSAGLSGKSVRHVHCA